MAWMEDCLRLHWNGPEPWDDQGQKLFDGSNHLDDWSGIWKHKLVVSQATQAERKSQALLDLDRQHRVNAKRRVKPKDYAQAKRSDLRAKMDVSMGVNPALVGKSARRQKTLKIDDQAMTCFGLCLMLIRTRNSVSKMTTQPVRKSLMLRL
jgi:hypothetical protein